MIEDFERAQKREVEAQQRGMVDPPPLSGPLKDIYTRLEKADDDIEILEAHAKAMIQRYEELLHIYRDLESRLHRVENKTYSLAESPHRKPCPSCGRLLPNPNAVKCPLCGAAIPQ